MWVSIAENHLMTNHGILMDTEQTLICVPTGCLLSMTKKLKAAPFCGARIDDVQTLLKWRISNSGTISGDVRESVYTEG